MKLGRWQSLYLLITGGFAAFAASIGLGAAGLGGCSSNNQDVDSGSSGSSSSSGGTCVPSGAASASGDAGSAGSCPALSGCSLPMHQTMAAQLTMNSMWPSTAAVAMDTGPVYLTLAIDYTVDSSNHFTGTMRTCQNQTPPITLSQLGDMASGFPMGSQVQVVISKSVWDKEPSVPVTGTAGGGSFTLDSVVALNGLKQDSQYKDPTVKWPPPSQMANRLPPVDPSEWSQEDMNRNDGGISATFKSMAPFVIPRVALSMTAPQTDEIYIVLRTQIALSGCMTSCTEGSGTATVPLLQNHVIGCHIPASDAGPESMCTPNNYNFIDLNSTAYQVVNGSYQSKILTNGSGASGAVTCDDVRAAFSQCM